MMTKLVGPTTARQGMEKIFDSFQEKTLNKHLLYTILHSLLEKLIPELNTNVN